MTASGIVIWILWQPLGCVASSFGVTSTRAKTEDDLFAGLDIKDPDGINVQIFCRPKRNPRYAVKVAAL
jgi:hypothetical protein